MKHKRIISIVMIAFLAFCAPNAGAISHSRDQRADGTVRYTFWISGADSRLLHSRFGYNLELADYIVRTLLSEAGVPSSFTTKFALAPAYGVAVSKTAYELWATSLRMGDVRWAVVYKQNPRAFRLIDQTLGRLGDRAMPFGEGANVIMGAINDILNTAYSSR